MIFHAEVTIQGENGDQSAPAQSIRPSKTVSSSTAGGNVSYSGGGSQQQGALAMAAAATEAQAPPGEEPVPRHVEQRRVDEAEQTGRNDPCWCGSGKKFKKCHGA
jgi:preprotein translocase subunit SecA